MHGLWPLIGVDFETRMNVKAINETKREREEEREEKRTEREATSAPRVWRRSLSISADHLLDVSAINLDSFLL